MEFYISQIIFSDRFYHYWVSIRISASQGYYHVAAGNAKAAIQLLGGEMGSRESLFMMFFFLVKIFQRRGR